MRVGRLKRVLFLSLVMSGVMTAAVSAQDVVVERQNLFKDLKKAMGTVKGVLDNKASAAEVAAPARLIANHAQKLPSLFPKGSEKGETKALPIVWSQWSNFEGGFKTLETAALTLAKAAESGNLGEVAKEFGNVGGVCSNCHDRFREK